MQSATPVAASRTCLSCTTDHSPERCARITDNCASAWVLRNQPEEDLNPVTGALLAFPDPYIRALISHAFRESILTKPLSDEDLLLVRDDTESTTRFLSSPEAADKIWADLQHLGRMVLAATSGHEQTISTIPSSYSRDYNNLEWIHSDFSRLLMHITFAGGDNLLRSLSNMLHESYINLTHDETLTRLTQKSMARIEAEKELAKRQRERVPAISQAQGEESDGMGQFVLHPTASTLGRRGLLAPYDPSQPGWDINLYAPSADVQMVDEDFNGLMKNAV
ncbi:hypothetical protein K435DRAFT_867145 [Dendrothele bispora CBS 962.96]|uniref:Uncharacterized protein n=1 Tax=Dendrothele bispora (strain CBS 962.96) TaxID=1314807 RepID=A0A4S8LF59_DENBC|nr:hypothetical protein K435DRAFT_867145 [Dendrothele bispora CBS 962.96]